jgi:sugar phosphate isomerase/epimerase
MTLKEQLDEAKAQGVDGIYFKSAMLLSPSLDPAELDGCAALAKERGMYLDVGLGTMNPYNTTEHPEVWALTGGDFLRAVQLQIEAGARLGCRDFISCCAGQKGSKHKGWFTVDRFRTDVDWADQLEATEKFLKLLAPILRDTGARVSLKPTRRSRAGRS